MGVGTKRPDFAEFYREAKDECLFTVLVSVGDRDTAQDLVDEAFARAWASWRTVSRHPAPAAWVVRTALHASISRWRRRRREVPVPDLALVADRPAAGGGDDSSVDPRIRGALLRLPASGRWWRCGCSWTWIPPAPRRFSASRPERSRLTWAARWPLFATTLSLPGSRRRTSHERRRADHGTAGAA